MFWFIFLEWMCKERMRLINSEIIEIGGKDSEKSGDACVGAFLMVEVRFQKGNWLRSMFGPLMIAAWCLGRVCLPSTKYFPTTSTHHLWVRLRCNSATLLPVPNNNLPRNDTLPTLFFFFFHSYHWSISFNIYVILNCS